MRKRKVILKVKNLNKNYISGYIRTSIIPATKNVEFDIKRGEIVSLVGESGSGKTTTAKMILRLIEPTSGHIFLDGKDAFSYDKREYYRKVQAIVQDPYSAYNTFYKIDRVLDKAFDFRGSTHPEKRKEIIDATLRSIGLNPEEVLGRYPHQLSGGQLQRFLIARALIIGSELLISDEPTSMIDASSRAGILNLFLDLKKRRNLSILFITHDIGQAQYISDKIIVMKKGEIVEMGPSEKVLKHPSHPYTKELLANVPKIYEKWEFGPRGESNKKSGIFGS